MNSEERHQARYERRKAQREWVRREKLAEFDNFERIADVNSLSFEQISTPGEESCGKQVSRDTICTFTETQ